MLLFDLCSPMYLYAVVNIVITCNALWQAGLVRSVMSEIPKAPVLHARKAAVCPWTLCSYLHVLMAWFAPVQLL